MEGGPPQTEAEAGVGMQTQVLPLPASAQLLWASVSPDTQYIVTHRLLLPGYLVLFLVGSTDRIQECVDMCISDKQQIHFSISPAHFV